MVYYTGEIFEQVDKYIGCKYTVTEVGHHKLGRHLVYSIKDENGENYILKIYGKAFRICNEITGLKLLENKIDCPILLKNGDDLTTVEWLLMSKIDGIILESVWDHLTIENKASVIIEMGEILGKIHNFYEYDFWGNWEESGTFILNHHDFLEYRKDSDKLIINNIKKQELSNKELLIRSYESLSEYYQGLNFTSSSRLCHHDYSARNILVKKDGENWKVSGVIDFEHCYPDDPDVDFTDLYHTIFLDEPLLIDYFFKGYNKYIERQASELKHKMEYYLLNKGLFICSWAYTAAPEYYIQGINLLKRLEQIK